MMEPTRPEDIALRHQKEDSEAIAKAVKEVLSSEAGRFLVAHLVSEGGVFRFTQPSDNLAYQAGHRDMALKIQYLCCCHAPEEYYRANQERTKLLNHRRQQLANARNRK